MTGWLPAPGELALFATATLLLNATPGVDLLLTLTRTLQAGARAGVAAALGIGAGCVVHALAAGFGLAALLALHPQAFLAVQWGGAAYLAWIGVGLLRQAGRQAGRRAGGPARRSAAADAALANAATVVSFFADFRRGLLTNVLNPKVALFFLAFLPQFVPAHAQFKTLAFLLLGAWFVIQGTLFLLATVWFAARLRGWQIPWKVSRALGGVAGLLFIALALRLVASRPAGP